MLICSLIVIGNRNNFTAIVKDCEKMKIIVIEIDCQVIDNNLLLIYNLFILVFLTSTVYIMYIMHMGQHV